MKKYIYITLVACVTISCVSQSTHDSVLKKCDSLMVVLESEREVIKSLEHRVSSLSDSVVMYSYPANQRYDYIVDLVKNEKIIEFYEGRIKSNQKELAAYEQVKKFILLSRPFTSDNGELTLTLKLKRKVIFDHYRDEIEKMYI